MPLSAVEPDSLRREESGFVVFLPHPLHPSGDQRLRLGLEAVLYGEAGEFGGEVFNRREPSLLQRVEGGDVSAELGSNQLLVVASAASKSGVLGDVEAGSGAFTPQGDGVNDLLPIQYTLFRVRQSSQVQVGVYALDGRAVWQAQPSVQGAGRHAVYWDGRDSTGQRVPPGTYLAQVEVETDKGREVRLQPVAVAY